MSHATLRTSLALGTTAIALTALTACGSSSNRVADGSARGASAPSAQASGAAQGSTGGFQGRNPGTSGQIAAKQGATLQVRNQTDGQVAVSYTDKTAITAQAAAALSDVKVGSCVTVTPARTAAPSAGASTTSGTASSVAAGQVRISDAVDGQCTGGFGGPRPGGMASGRPSSVPSDRPSDRPSGRPSNFTGGGRGGFMFANGKVTAVTGSGFTVENRFPGRGGADGSSSSAGSSTPTSVSVTVDGSTTYTTTTSADASALKVGTCVTATGQADSTGAVAADRLVVSDPVNGSCSSGFGFDFGAPGGQHGRGGADSTGGTDQQGGAA